jgi:DNA-binding transcriptional MerR regulator
MHDINPNTLRTWERRYGLVKPMRGPGGQRGYSSADIGVIEQMLHLIKSGATPSEAAAQIQKSRAKPARPSAPHPLRKEFAAQSAQYSLAGLGHLCATAERELGYAQAVETILFPELERLGETWHNTAGGIAREHCTTLAVSTYLAGRLRRKSPQGPHDVVLACVPDEQHNLSVLHIGNLLVEHGQINPLILVAGVPLQETLSVAQKSATKLLVLSSTVAASAATVREWAQEIINSGWEQQTILTGSGFRNSRIFSETKLRSGAGSYQQVANLIRQAAL